MIFTICKTHLIAHNILNKTKSANPSSKNINAIISNQLLRVTSQFTKIVVFFKTCISNEPVKFKVLHRGYYALLTKKEVVQQLKGQFER